jgi:hypothetical protein
MPQTQSKDLEETLAKLRTNLMSEVTKTLKTLPEDSNNRNTTQATKKYYHRQEILRDIDSIVRLVRLIRT